MKRVIEPVVGILDQNNFQLYKTVGDVPEGAVSFTCWQDMARMLNQETMDRIRQHILGKRFFRYSASREDAAINLWITMTRDARLLPGIDLNRVRGRVRDKMGNLKFPLHGPHELLHIAWRPGDVRPPLIAERIRKLNAQAKVIYDLLLEDGREVLTHSQIIQIMNANWPMIGSCQSPIKLLRYYLTGAYYPLQMIRKITYLDFCRSKTLRNIDLDIASLESPENPPVPEGQDSVLAELRTVDSE